MPSLRSRASVITRFSLLACVAGACSEPSIRERECELVRTALKRRIPRRTYSYAPATPDPLLEHRWQDPEISRAVERLQGGSGSCTTSNGPDGNPVLWCPPSLEELCGIARRPDHLR